MKKLIKNLFISCLLSCLLFYGSSLKAQETVTSAGGKASGDNGSASYTVGQIAISTIVGENGSVAPGVQQPYETWLISGHEHARDISLEYKVFPNPTAHNVTLKVKNHDQVKLKYYLYHATGKLLECKDIVSNETPIHMEFLTPATYFLKVSDGKKEEIVFKINKK